MRFRVLFFALYTFVGGLLPHSDLHELSKISYLVQHFSSHQARSAGSLSFAEFIRMHYEDSKHMSSENHDQLPLKQMGNSPYDFFVREPFLRYQTVTTLQFTKKPFIHAEPNHNDRFTGSVWQPPQVA